MDILFRTGKLREQCSDSKHSARIWGTEQARKIGQRLDELRAAPHLGVMRALPGRCHELRGERSGQLSVDLAGPYRLVFEAADEPLPIKGDGGLDWDRVTAIRILEVADTHG